jgi:hypothetical protein
MVRVNLTLASDALRFLQGFDHLSLVWPGKANRTFESGVLDAFTDLALHHL